MLATAAELLLYAAEKEAIDDVRAQLIRALYRDGFMEERGRRQGYCPSGP
jgi:hypothetical protein